MALSTGTILAGRYEITAPIATGGMGEVWRARDRVLDRVVAAKVLRSEFTGDPSFVARFRNEARHTAALTHPNIASVYDYGETTEDERFPGQQLAFLVMELVEGKPLVTILHEEGKLPADWTLHVLGQAADGLSAAHKAGVVHRDIKPGNLIVRPDGVVKLTDFGIARARDATPLTRTGMVVGTAQYLSPEQAQGFEVTAASDVYSLGVVGYECLTGGRPFDGTSQVAVALAHINRPPPPLPATVPPAVRLLIERALAKDPADRFADGAAFAAAVRSVAAGNGLAGTSGTGAVFPQPTSKAAEPPTAATELLADGDNSRTQVLGATSAAAAAVGAAGQGPGTAPGTMPPLRRPSDDEDSTWEGRHRATDDRRWGWLVAGLVALALLAGGVWYLLAGGDDPAGTTPESTTAATTSASSAAGTVTVATDSYVGRDGDEVAALLEQDGLVVETRDATEDEVARWDRAIDAGAVVGSDPANQPVPVGGTVTLFLAPEDYTPPADEEPAPTEDQQQPAPTQDTPTTTPSVPASSSNPGGTGGQQSGGNGPGSDEDENPDGDTGDGDGGTEPDSNLPGNTPEEPAPTVPTTPSAPAVEGQGAGSAAQQAADQDE
ncbi:serine/threonine protein kinase [Geodermatophilus sp. CPCC 205506]|uniref:serine/threonine-protein kinase n=1 Tax=Geodermatophilus sp. CPCC 205506 TaxID=2936596 RepID=UPI003EEA231E